MQSNLIFGFLLAAYIIYVVTKNELPKYLGFILGGQSGVKVTAQPTVAQPNWPAITVPSGS